MAFASLPTGSKRVIERPSYFRTFKMARVLSTSMPEGEPEAQSGAPRARRARRTRLWILVAAIVIGIVFVYVFVFVPEVPAAVPDGCVDCTVHYHESLSCSIAGFGTSEWHGTFYLGCSPPSIP
jgi:hypothetical protein